MAREAPLKERADTTAVTDPGMAAVEGAIVGPVASGQGLGQTGLGDANDEGCIGGGGYGKGVPGGGYMGGEGGG